MKILRDGKEVKNATVIYDVSGRPDMIRIDNVFYDINAFELVDTKDVVRTKDSEENQVIKPIQKIVKKIKK